MSTTATSAPSPNRIPAEALDQLFRNARTHSAWRNVPVPLDLLKQPARRFSPASPYRRFRFTGA